MPVLVDIALVGVVVPLDAVQRGSSADLPSRNANHEQYRKTKKQMTMKQ
jgi:hypothetical protein